MSLLIQSLVISVASFVVAFSTEAFPIALAVSILTPEKALKGVFLIKEETLRIRCRLSVSVVMLALREVAESVALLVSSHPREASRVDAFLIPFK